MRREGAGGLRISGWSALGRYQRMMGPGLAWMGMGWRYRWLASALGIQYVLAKGGCSDGEAAVRGRGSAHVALERLVDVDGKLVTQGGGGFSAEGGIINQK